MSVPVKLLSTDHFIQSSSQTDLVLRVRYRGQARDPGSAGQQTSSTQTPLLMVHGATVSSLLWDHPLPQWSWMNRLALNGFDVYALDLRGYGGSSRPENMQVKHPEDLAPYATAADVQQDLVDVIGFIQDRHGVTSVDLLGGSWGSIICGMFASSARASLIRKLVLYAPIYDEGHTHTSWWKGAVNPENHCEINPRLGAFRWVSRQGLKSRWDDEIPFNDKSIWRSDEVFDTLFEACLSEDPGSRVIGEAAFRAPNGTLVDLFAAYTGKPVFDATSIKVPTLLIRGDHDDTSSRVGTLKLFDQIASEQKVYCEVGNGAHFVILESQGHRVHSEVVAFLCG